MHYPLPLAYVKSPEREQLERTINRLGEVRGAHTRELSLPRRTPIERDRMYVSVWKLESFWRA